MVETEIHRTLTACDECSEVAVEGLCPHGCGAGVSTQNVPLYVAITSDRAGERITVESIDGRPGDRLRDGSRVTVEPDDVEPYDLADAQREATESYWLDAADARRDMESGR